ncbi:hypothetical protein ABZP36_012244 [Zizania latifolia]
MRGTAGEDPRPEAPAANIGTETPATDGESVGRLPRGGAAEGFGGLHQPTHQRAGRLRSDVGGGGWAERSGHEARPCGGAPRAWSPPWAPDAKLGGGAWAGAPPS